MADVDTALGALSDPTRRRVLERLADGPRRTNELAQSVGVSVPAISRHLRVLRERGLVARFDVDDDGRGRRYRLEPDGLAPITEWIQNDRWTTELSAATGDPDVDEFLTRVGGFLDAFAQSDSDFFERHLADDTELIFPGSPRIWGKKSTVASVAGHAPYAEWDITNARVRAVGPGLTLVVVAVDVRTTRQAAPTSVVQSMLFDDASDPWTLRFLQQTPTAPDT